MIHLKTGGLKATVFFICIFIYKHLYMRVNNVKKDSIEEIKELLSRIDESYGLINESAETDKLKNVRDVNIERCRRVLIKALKTGQFPYFKLKKLSANPSDYSMAPGGMKAGLDDNGCVFPQWPDCKPGDPATSTYGSMVSIYSQGYKVATEVNYNPGYGSEQLPSGKYELNGAGHDNWVKAYTPFLNGLISNLPCAMYPKVNGVYTYGALGFIIYNLMSNRGLMTSPRDVFNMNKIVKYMAKIGLFDESVKLLKQKVSRNWANMTEGGQKIIGSNGPIIGNDGSEILDGNNGTNDDVINDLQNELAVDRNLINRFSDIEEELNEYIKTQKEASLEKYMGNRIQSGKKKRTNNGYTILRIDNFDEAMEFRKYVTWCICTSVDSFDEYGMADGEYSGKPAGGRIYFCLKDGYQTKQKPDVQDGNPLDEYGLSMIAVTVFAEDGSCNTITSRWNHANGGSDNVMSPEELEEILGVSFYEAFPGKQ